MERRVEYFADYGEQNTAAVVDCVSRRLDEGDVTTVVVATSSGKTALLFAEALARRPGLRLIAVGNPPGSAYEPIPPENRLKLSAKGVIVIDYAPYGCSALQGDAHRNMYGALDLLVVVADVWRMMGGQGLKVAMEVGLMATNSGADTAIVMKTALSLDILSAEPERRPDLLEFICTPVAKKWW